MIQTAGSRDAVGGPQTFIDKECAEWLKKS